MSSSSFDEDDIVVPVHVRPHKVESPTRAQFGSDFGSNFNKSKKIEFAATDDDENGENDDSDDVEEPCPKKIVFIGNVGCGKSTLINTLLGRAACKSGVKFGGGPMTTTVQSIRCPWTNFTYIDTPGLCDASTDRKTVNCILASLKRVDEPLCLVFVVTLHAGRVDLRAASTVRMVLGAIDMPDVKYAVVVNRLGRRLMRCLADRRDREPLYRTLGGVCPKSPRVSDYFLHAHNEAWHDQDNVSGAAAPFFHEFMRALPTMTVKPDCVKPIELDRVDSLVEQRATLIEGVGRLKEMARLRIEELTCQLDATRAELEALRHD
jgi:GTP-binding protein EngB required for normal cell division